MIKGLAQGKARLGFPGRAAGFDPTHPMSSGLRMNAVAVIGQVCMRNITPLLTSTITNAPTSPIIGFLGPTVQCITGTDAVNLSPNGATMSQGTFAGIWQHTAVSGTRQCLLGNAATTIEFHVTTTGFEWYLNGGNASSTIVLTAGVPYFVAASGATTGSMNFLAKNLNTGQVQTQVVAGTLTAGTFGTPVQIGNGGGGSNPALAAIAAVAISANFLSMPTLLAWADDPWSFWYPDFTLSASQLFMVKNPASQAGAIGTTILTMGVG